MRSRYRLAVFITAASAALLTPVVLRATHPPTIPLPARAAKTMQSTPNPSGTPQYRFTTIDAPGTSDTEAYGINNPGVITGFYVVNGIGHGFWWRSGVLMTVDHPGPSNTNTLLGDVSEPGLVAGNYGPFDTQHAAIYHIGTDTWTTLPDVPNLPINLGNGINPQGIVVGSAATGSVAAPKNSVGWTWDGRKYSLFTVPGEGEGADDLGTEAVGINAPGDVSGYFQDVNGTFHGFLKHGSAFTHIDVPGATDTFAFGLNNRGDQVGYFLDQEGGIHGFVLSAGTFTTIDVPGSLATLVTNINDKGDLSGLWFDANSTHAFTASLH